MIKPLNPVLHEILKWRYLNEQSGGASVARQGARAAGQAARAAGQAAKEGARQAIRRGLSEIDDEVLERVIRELGSSSIEDVFQTKEGTVFSKHLTDEIENAIEKNIENLSDPNSLRQKVVLDVLNDSKLAKLERSRRYMPLVQEIESRVQQRTNELFPKDELLPPETSAAQVGAQRVPKPVKPPLEIPGKPPPEVTPPPNAKPKPKIEAEEDGAPILGTIKDIGAAGSAALLGLAALRNFTPSAPQVDSKRYMEPEEYDVDTSTFKDDIGQLLFGQDQIDNRLSKGKLGQYGGYYYAE